MPQALPEHPLPPTLQVTAVLAVLITVAVNDRVFPATTCATAGETVIATGGRMVTVADAALELSATEVALTITCVGLGTVSGAV